MLPSNKKAIYFMSNNKFKMFEDNWKNNVFEFFGAKFNQFNSDKMTVFTFTHFK
jgi:hypothetical protein